MGAKFQFDRGYVSLLREDKPGNRCRPKCNRPTVCLQPAIVKRGSFDRNDPLFFYRTVHYITHDYQYQQLLHSYSKRSWHCTASCIQHDTTLILNTLLDRVVCMQCIDAAFSAQRSVIYVFGKRATCAKTAKPIEMPFAGSRLMKVKQFCIRVGPNPSMARRRGTFNWELCLPL